MTKTLKNIREAISSSQLKRLKKEYEPLRKIDMSKHKGQVEKTTAMLSKLKMGTLIDLYKENIPWISDIAKSLVKKDKRFAHHVEEVEESIIMGLNKSSAEYKAGKEAAKKGIKYDANPHAPGVKRLNWSTGHNDFRADALRKAGKPNYGARGQFEEVQLDEMGPFQQVSKLLIKYGNNPKEVKRMMTKHMPYVTKKYPNASPAKVAEIISSLSATEELEEGTWATPRTSKQARELTKLLKKPLRADDALDKLYNLLGDDELYDDLEDIKRKSPKTDVRPIVAFRLNQLGFHQFKEEVEIDEADLTKTQIKKVHDKADELPKHDFIKRYGKDGDSVRYATATNIVKKKLGIGEEVTEERSPEVAGVLKKYIIGHPLRWSSREGKKNKKDFIKLQNLALTDMGKFRKKFADMEADKGDDNYNQQAVRDVLAKAGLSKHLPK